MIGKIIDGRYRLQSLLSENTDSKTYIATEYYGNKVIVRALRKDNRIIYEMLYKELELMMKLKHPYISKIFECIEDSTYTYIIVEYIDGCSMREYLRLLGQFPEEKVIKYSMQIAIALQYIHSLNPPVINRDIKPDNIAIDSEDNIKLFDFGSAMEYTSNKDDGIALCTRGYAPPEQYCGKTVPQSDMFALGMLMCHLLTGIHPANMQYGDDIVNRLNCSRGLKEIIKKCIRLEPTARYSSDSELVVLLMNLYHPK